MPFPIEEQYIVIAEQELNYRFPPSFRNRMMQNNGGEIEIRDDIWHIFPFFDQADIKRKMRTYSNIIFETRQIRKWAGFPEQAIAFAQNGNGDYLIFLPKNTLSSEHAEPVFIWFHGTTEIKKIADDFQVLL